MTRTKSHLIDAIAEQNGFTKKKSTETIETILEIIKSEGGGSFSEGGG